MDEVEVILSSEIRDCFLTMVNDPYMPSPFQWLEEEEAYERTHGEPVDKLTKKCVKLLKKAGYTEPSEFVTLHWAEIIVDGLTKKEMLDLYAAGRKVIKKSNVYVIIPD